MSNFATSCWLAPSVKRTRRSRSVLTDRSAASILATLDWLDPQRFATSAWVSPRRSRRLRRPVARAALVSMNRCSSADRSRKSAASPTVQPARSRRCRLVFCTGSISLCLGQSPERLQSPPAVTDDRAWRSGGLLAEHLQNHHGISCQAVHDPPCLAAISDAQFVASGPNGRHWPRSRQTQRFTLLQPSQQESGINSSFRTKRRCLDFSAQPDHGLVTRVHVDLGYVT